MPGAGRGARTRRPHPTVAVEAVKMADGEIGRYTVQPGWRWPGHVEGSDLRTRLRSLWSVRG